MEPDKVAEAVGPVTLVPEVATSHENALTTIFSPPFNAVIEPGRVTVYARPLVPVTVNEADVTAAVAGRIIPPVEERVGEAFPGRITVPAVPATILPKFIELLVAIVIALTSVPVAVAVCPKETAENPKTMIARASNIFTMLFFNISGIFFTVIQ